MSERFLVGFQSSSFSELCKFIEDNLRHTDEYLTKIISISHAVNPNCLNLKYSALVVYEKDYK